jgi:hypothetical protein
MPSILKILLQFALAASSPHATCELVHRDPDVAGTYYLYCSQSEPDGTEMISVGRFISDAPVSSSASPGEEHP